MNPREALELLALRLALYGPMEATPGLVRQAAVLWVETGSLLREHGFSEAERNELMGRHPLGCPCLGCVWRLHRLVKQHQDKMRRKYKRRRAPVGL